MMIDMFGKKRYKLGLHQHSTRSDGALTPAEVATLYREAGYDAITLNDHWVYSGPEVLEGLPIFSGAEYHVGYREAGEGIYHIISLFTEREPQLVREEATVQGIIDAIHEAGGLAVLGHPAWSLNTPDRVRLLKNVDATEIYNTVSYTVGREDSSVLVDMFAMNGQLFPLIAADDFHRTTAIPHPVSAIMVESESLDAASLKSAIREGRFYATQGPEIHLKREGNTVKVYCSPASKILFYSNIVVSANRLQMGEGLTEATYQLNENEHYVRAEVVDAEGRRAFSNFLTI